MALQDFSTGPENTRADIGPVDDPGAAESGDDDSRRPLLPGTEWIVRALDRPLRQMWSHGFRFLFLLDAVGLFGAMVVINFVRFGVHWPTYTVSFYLAGFAGAALIHLVVNYFCGLYEREPRLGRRPWLSRVFVATGVGIGIQAAAYLFLNRYLMPRFSLVVFAFAGSAVLVANRWLSRKLAVRRQGLPRVILVGDDVERRRASSHIAAIERELHVVGTVGDIDHLAEAIVRGNATDVLLLGSASLDNAFPEPITSLERQGVGFLKLVGARDTLLGLQAVREIASMPFAPLLVHTFPSYKARLKRLFDLVLVVATAPLTLPILGLLALFTLLRAGAPVLYRQTRIGRDGELFTVVKFRTMQRDAEAAGAQLATGDDPRIVRGMKWMRETRADELPQLWNVLRGEMSLVGPRPERPELATDIEQHVAGWVRRHQLAPGLTGLAQINGRYASRAEYKIGYDLQYLVNWSLVLDLQILAKTVIVVVTRRV